MNNLVHPHSLALESTLPSVPKQNTQAPIPYDYRSPSGLPWLLGISMEYGLLAIVAIVLLLWTAILVSSVDHFLLSINDFCSLLFFPIALHSKCKHNHSFPTSSHH